MKLPSLQRLAAEAARVVRRFPLTLLCSLLLGAVGIYYQRLSFTEKIHLEWLFPLLSAAGLGLILTLNAALAGERYRWPVWLKVLISVGAVALLVLWYGLCPAELTVVWGLRLALLLLGLHLLVAVVPYLPELRRQADTAGFWRYNEILFLRILTAGLYSGVLYVGCALALAAVENLFDVKLDRHVYEHLFTVLATGFNTWFFLAGVPHNWVALEQETTYPKGLKLFTQFVLLPLVVLYLVILYAYLARILVRWELPQGWVSTLVLAFSVAGIFALLLIHPIRNATENTWIRTFARWFYRALFPLLGLLFVAIGTRVIEYGVTEERYFVLVLAAWLAVMAVYFLWRQGQGIVWVPASLAVVAFLAAGGPWGAFAVAERSQLNQLREISAQYGLLKDGKLDGAGKRVPDLPKQAQQRIASVFDFFVDRNGAQQLQPFFTASLRMPDSTQQIRGWKQQDWLRSQLVDVSSIPESGADTSESAQMKTTNFQPDNFQVWPVGRGRYILYNLDLVRYNQPATEEVAVFTIPEGEYRLWSVRHGRQLQLQRRINEQWQRLLTMRPGALADSLAQVHGQKPQESVELSATGLTLRTSGHKMSLQVLFHQFNREEKNTEVEYNYQAMAILEFNN